MNYFEALKNRRSIHFLEDVTVVPDEQVIEIVETALNHVPTAFNGQETRAVVIFNDEHRTLWNRVEEVARAKNGDRDFSRTESRINGFRNGHGTILFFQDTAITKGFQEKMPNLHNEFDVWAQQNQGMLQYAIWTGLEAVGYAASLQHMEVPLKEEWNIPSTWTLIAQMPFGKQNQELTEKHIVPVKEKLIVIR
ncbi:nitroreductase family protein [Lysinibacillus halotolerans]|uniref:Nitroreductase family protein n=1 Tax=Lysinibacillus halotolerans TaxID=1368476 RepID=A0A3M8H8A1_9BACI|nr:nitroreductase family protein [Lysinibacillus halotolerans]RNC98454.1 nitroreductase family protein [Lysinibacillus halotolerans]